MMLTTKTAPVFLLDAVSGRVRKALVRERARAMAGQLDSTLATLHELASRCDSAVDRISIQLLRVELLDADQQHDEAHRVFEQSVQIERKNIPEQYWTVIDRNKVDLNAHTFLGTDQFYHLIDRERAEGINWLDYRSLYYAQRASESNKRYESLPIIWRQLQNAYLSGSWSAQRAASRLFIDECLASGELDLAVLHLILSGDENSGQRIVDAVLSIPGIEPVLKVILRVLTTANLKRHAALACKLLSNLADLIPDDEVPRVADWLFSYAELERYAQLGSNPMIEAWKAIRLIGARLDIERAAHWLELLLKHPAWTTRLNDPSRVVLGREEILKAALPIVHVLRSESDILERLGNDTLNMLKDCHTSNEYNEALNLLCNLAEWGGQELKTRIADALYIINKPVNYNLVSLVKFFGKDERIIESQLQAMATKVAQDILRQVQHPQPGLKPVSPGGTIMESYSEGNTTRPVVYSVDLSNLNALVQHRNSLTQDSLAEVLRAVLRMAGDADNFLSNRHNLLQLVQKFADCAESPLRREVIDALEPIACGQVNESIHYSKASDAKNPYNPIKFDFGSPESVQAMAMAAFTAFASTDESQRDRISKILLPQFYDSKPRVREGACYAARFYKQIDSETLAGLLAALRDPDPEVVGMAFVAIEQQPTLQLNPSQRRALLLAVRFAADSPSGLARCRAARALQAVANNNRAYPRKEFQEMLDLFRHDRAYSVRCVVSIR